MCNSRPLLPGWAGQHVRDMPFVSRKQTCFLCLRVNLPLPGTGTTFGPGYCELLLRNLALLAFRLVDLSRGAEEGVRRVHHRFAKCRMRMNRLGDIRHFAAHLDRERGLGNKLSGASPN